MYAAVDDISAQKPPSSDLGRAMQVREGRSGADIHAGKGFGAGIGCRDRRKGMAKRACDHQKAAFMKNAQKSAVSGRIINPEPSFTSIKQGLTTC